MEKTLSIIVPTYNMELLLARCLNSFIIPCIKDDIEVLIVNDGSKDNSKQIAETFVAKEPHLFKLINKENGNYGSAVNVGIQNATAKYLRIVDADDFVDQDGFLSYVAYLKATDVDLIVTNFTREHGKSVIRINSGEQYYAKDINVSNFDFTKKPGTFCMHGMTFRTIIFKDNNISLLHGISYTDSEFLFYPMEYVNTMSIIDIPVYRYQLDRDGQTVSKSALLRNKGHLELIINRMLDNLDALDKNSITYLTKSTFIPLSLYMEIMLCRNDKTPGASFDRIVERLKQHPRIIERLLPLNIYGIKYFDRFYKSGRIPNNTFIRYYIGFVELLKKYYFLLKNI